MSDTSKTKRKIYNVMLKNLATINITILGIRVLINARFYPKLTHRELTGSSATSGRKLRKLPGLQNHIINHIQLNIEVFFKWNTPLSNQFYGIFIKYSSEEYVSEVFTLEFYSLRSLYDFILKCYGTWGMPVLHTWLSDNLKLCLFFVLVFCILYFVFFFFFFEEML